jgi:hypothetical protein
MVVLNVDRNRYGNEIEEWSEDGGMERFTRHAHGAYPVRSHASRIRGIVRSRATASSRRKAHAIGGLKRRHRRSAHWDWAR